MTLRILTSELHLRCRFTQWCSLFMLAVTAGACGPEQAGDKAPAGNTGIKQHDSVYGEDDEAYYAEHDTFFIVVADTGNDYYALRQQMLDIAGTTGLTIDTMGRYYDRSKDLIQLPEDDDDEMYRGDYFPRRFPSGHLSLEYLVLYKPLSGDKTIALVTGIYESEHAADSARKAVSQIQPGAFVLKSGIYVGCLH